MSTRRICSLVCAVAVLILIAAQATAQLPDRRTFFAFSAPVEVPGVALPPGRYLFRFADPDSGGKVVQVLSEDGKKVYAMFFSIAAYRPSPPDNPEVRFLETPGNAPPAIKTWWYPGESIGREFIYPKTQALRLAKASSEPVLTTHQASTTADQTNTTNLSRVSANGQETQVSAGSKAVANAPKGAANRGEAAPSSLSISPNAAK
ncbi:MAG TPA: hypothetical protein VGZ27_13905 [Vicinamibacterales bacterium]|nr:hypothetical protein [Vicinamibacterales bacterium]